MPLDKFPKSFGLTGIKKGYFPYLFKNTKYVGPLDGIPIKYFCFKKLKDKKTYDEAVEWYEKNKNTIFDYQKELVEYCMNDVQILRQGCIKFRNNLLNINKQIDEINVERKKMGLEPFVHVTPIDIFQCATIASFTQSLYLCSPQLYNGNLY